MSENKVHIVGVVPGSPRYLTAEAKSVIKETNIVVAWEKYIPRSIERFHYQTVFLAVSDGHRAGSS
jgi:precorrin-3B methylase